MPWHIAKSGSCPASRPWAVIKDDDGEIEGCHATEEAAQKQLAALNIAENASEWELEDWEEAMDYVASVEAIEAAYFAMHGKADPT